MSAIPTTVATGAGSSLGLEAALCMRIASERYYPYAVASYPPPLLEPKRIRQNHKTRIAPADAEVLRASLSTPSGLKTAASRQIVVRIGSSMRQRRSRFFT